jgi:hypothetical protein
MAKHINLSKPNRKNHNKHKHRAISPARPDDKAQAKMAREYYDSKAKEVASGG